MNKLYLICLFCVFLGACGSSIDTKNFQSKEWKNDPQGCKGLRLQEMEHLKEIQESLIGLGEPEIQKILGKPDKKEIQERMNHLTTYYLEKGPKCDEPMTQGKKLILEYNGLNQLILLTVQK